MNIHSCCSCQNPKASLECGLCKKAVCKSCAHFMADDSFSFLPQIPEELSHTTYCRFCFDSKVAGAIQEYDETMAKAREVLVFNKSQGKETRLVRRLEKPISVANCLDEAEATMKLAFLAAKLNYNSIIDVDIVAEKIRSGTYQTTMWRGTAVPANFNDNKIIRDRSIWQNPN